VGRRLPRLAVALALAACSGCWLQIGADGGHTRSNPTETSMTTANVAGLHQVWSVNVHGGASEPLIFSGRAFVSWTTRTATGIEAVSLADGATAWDNQLQFVPAVDGSFVAGTPASLVNGQVRGGDLAFVPVVRGGGPDCVGEAASFDPQTGAGGHAEPEFPTATVTTRDVVARSVIDLSPAPACTLNGAILEVTAGTTRWSARYPGFPSSDLTPTVGGDQVFVSHSGTLDAFATAGCGADTCSPIWSKTFAGGLLSTAVAGPTGPVLVAAEGDLVALDRTDGTELWRAPGAGGRIALANGTVYVETSTGGSASLQTFAAAGCGSPTCGPVWTATLPGTAVTAPAVGGDVVYTSTDTGVQAFAAAGCGSATCTPLVNVPQPSFGTITVGLGHVLRASGTTLTALAVA
jgi:outer membrane protein assembly factor BamB